MKISGSVAASMLALLCAGAHAEDRAILANEGVVHEACGAASEVGVTCEFISASDIDRAAPDAQLSVPDALGCRGTDLDVPFERKGLLDHLTKPKYCAQALIYSRTDPQGQTYLMVRMAALKRLGDFAPAFDADRLDLAWSAFDRIVRSVPASSPEAATYLASLDEEASRLAAKKAAESAAIAAAKAKVAAEAVYRETDQYKQEQARAAVSSCRQSIARARRAIAQDERVAQISGYENKLLREQAAVTIVNCQDIIANAGVTAP